MKKIYQLGALLTLTLMLASCRQFTDRVDSRLNSPIITVLTMMADEGYTNLDENNTPSQYAYYENKIATDYDLELDVTGFYQGYVNEDERWAMIVVFASTSDAIAFYNALITDNVFGYVAINGNVVLHTSSNTTYLAFQITISASSSSLITTSSATSTGSSSSISSSNNVSSSSSSSSTYKTENEMLTILYNAGYSNLAGNNDQGTWDYREESYFTNYGLTVTMTGFYQGYVPEYTRWVMMEVFATTTQAADIYNALMDDDTVDSYIVIEGKIVLQTASLDTYLLF